MHIRIYMYLTCEKKLGLNGPLHLLDTGWESVPQFNQGLICKDQTTTEVTLLLEVRVLLFRHAENLYA